VAQQAAPSFAFDAHIWILRCWASIFCGEGVPLVSADLIFEACGGKGKAVFLGWKTALMVQVL
jgi:hypothetical protein